LADWGQRFSIAPFEVGVPSCHVLGRYDKETIE